jgi:hypothetical protein
MTVYFQRNCSRIFLEELEKTAISSAVILGKDWKSKYGVHEAGILTTKPQSWVSF